MIAAAVPAHDDGVGGLGLDGAHGAQPIALAVTLDGGGSPLPERVYFDDRLLGTFDK